jgi:hypothetical protein
MAVTLKSTNLRNVKPFCLVDVCRLSCKASVYLYETAIHYISEGSIFKPNIFLRGEQLKITHMQLPENCKSPCCDRILTELIQVEGKILFSEIH